MVIFLEKIKETSKMKKRGEDSCDIHTLLKYNSEKNHHVNITPAVHEMFGCLVALVSSL